MSDNDNKLDTKQEQESKVLSFSKGKRAKKSPSERKKKEKQPKQKITIGFILGMIILILIAISFVAGPAIQGILGGKSAGSLTFGKYGKQDISYAYGNYFYDQVQAAADQHKGSGEDPTQVLYQIWKSAYDSTVVYTAVEQLAAKAGIIATEEALNRAIINSGVYHKDGKFDVATYQNASMEAKTRLKDQMRRSFPYQVVFEDVGTVLSSDAEKAYVSAMAEEGRSFSYLIVDAGHYPDELAIAYAQENTDLFVSVDLSIISLVDAELASQVAREIILGTTTFEDAAMQHSLDSFAQYGGAVGRTPYYAISEAFTNAEDALQLLSAKSGDIIGPIESQGAWTILKANSDAHTFDIHDETAVLEVKGYLASQESTIVDPWLAEFSETLAAEAAFVGLETLADQYDMELFEIPATPFNAANSSYISSLSYYDPTGMLTHASTQEGVAKQLYKSPEGTLLAPIKVGASYLLVETGADEQDEGSGSYVAMFYDYLASSQNQGDLSQALYASSEHQNDFLSTFFTTVLGQ